MSDNNNTILTDENINDLSEAMDKNLQESESLQAVANLPSSNGVIEREAPEEKGEFKMASVSIDPTTGEHKIVATSDTSDDNFNESFEEMVDRVERGETSFDKSEESDITKEEFNNYITESKTNKNSVYNELFGDKDISEEDILTLLDIVNRKKSGEKFNVYKAYPESVRNMIDSYMSKQQISSGTPIPLNNNNMYKNMRNMISESLLNDFVSNIEMSRIQEDLHKEIEDIFSKSTSEIADSIIGYTTERNAKYREYADKMNDPEKKAKVLAILDSIDEAYNLSQLKEFSKKVKIRSIDLEKKNAKSLYAFNQFLEKYKDSSYNIYSIYTAEQVLNRALNSKGITENVDGSVSTNFTVEYSFEDCRVFLIAFCNQCNNYKPTNIEQHAYMYYVLYNIVLSDLNNGENKKVSDVFLDNVKECINNLRERNKNVLKK